MIIYLELSKVVISIVLPQYLSSCSNGYTIYNSPSENFSFLEATATLSTLNSLYQSIRISSETLLT